MSARIAVSLIIESNENDVFDLVKDLKKLPDYFDFIECIEEVDTQQEPGLGKVYLEYVKDRFYSRKPVSLQIVEFVQPKRIKIQSDGRFFNHGISIECHQINDFKVKLELAYVIDKNIFILKVPGIRKYLEKRLRKGLKKIKLCAEGLES